MRFRKSARVTAVGLAAAPPRRCAWADARHHPLSPMTAHTKVASRRPRREGIASPCPPPKRLSLNVPCRSKAGADMDLLISSITITLTTALLRESSAPAVARTIVKIGSTHCSPHPYRAFSPSGHVARAVGRSVMSTGIARQLPETEVRELAEIGTAAVRSVVRELRQVRRSGRGEGALPCTEELLHTSTRGDGGGVGDLNSPGQKFHLLNAATLRRSNDSCPRSRSLTTGPRSTQAMPVSRPIDQGPSTP